MKKENIKPAILIILDGLGFSKEKKYNAVYQAKTPNLNKWIKEYPNTLLKTSGEAVGLLKNYMGNSEVGHLTIGAGRIIKQPMTILHKEIKNKNFFKNKVLNKDLEKLKKNNGNLHLIGLLSDAGVHSHIKHLFAFLEAAKKHKIKKAYIHVFLDGRDTPPTSAKKYLTQLQNFIKKIKYGEIASIQGRFFAMDRNKNWTRTKKAYDILTVPQKNKYINWQKVLEKNYSKKITDEFIKPFQINPKGIIQPKDGIIFFNFRSDRARQLTDSFVNPKFNSFKTKKINLSFFLTPVEYSTHLKTDFLIKNKPIRHTLMEELCQNNMTTFSIAETEKYAHITYFFNARREQLFPNETRVLIKSLPIKSYDLKPKMSANLITKKVLESLKQSPKNFYLINYANPDMVGHSGNIKATIKAIEFLDKELKKIYNQIIKLDGTLYITADHGNAEEMYDPNNGHILTSHTTNPVRFIMIRKDLTNRHLSLPLKQLSDIAPFILKNFNLPIPKEMKLSST
jgi:2,3-bisphosphoglycerate-independent phosphoglycerate mutase